MDLITHPIPNIEMKVSLLNKFFFFFIKVLIEMKLNQDNNSNNEELSTEMISGKIKN